MGLSEEIGEERATVRRCLRREAVLLRMIYADAYAALYDETGEVATSRLFSIADRASEEHQRITGVTIPEYMVSWSERKCNDSPGAQDDRPG